MFHVTGTILIYGGEGGGGGPTGIYTLCIDQEVAWQSQFMHLSEHTYIVWSHCLTEVLYL